MTDAARHDRYISIGEADLHVAVRGTGPPVVLHPSLGRWARDFGPIVGPLVDAGFQTIAVNPRGVDGSTGPLDGVTQASLAADVVGVMDAFGIDAAHLVGHAFGNRVVRQLAADHPARARSVTLLGAGGRIPGTDEARAAVGRSFDLELPEAERLDDIATAFFAPGNDPTIWLEGWFPEAKEAQQRALLSADGTEWWFAGEAPMLVVQGLQDAAAPPANGHALATERTAPTDVVDIDGAGHALLPEQPDRVAHALIELLLRVEAQQNEPGPR